MESNQRQIHDDVSNVSNECYISHFGRLKPSVRIEDRGNKMSNFRLLSSLAIDDQSEYIFLIDSSLYILSVFSDSFDFLTCITLESLKAPYGIAVHRNIIILTDIAACAVFLMKEENGFCSTKSIGTYGSGNDQFIRPSHPDISNCGDVYIPDELNHRIQVYTPELMLLFSLKSSSVRNPVNVKVRSSMVFVLSFPPFSLSCIHIFSNSSVGELLNTIELQRNGISIRSIFFSVDRLSNVFLFREVSEDIIHVFSDRWSLLYSLELEKSSYIFPEGMAVTNDLCIVIVSFLDTKYNLQLYSK